MINLKVGGIIVAAFVAGAFVASPELRAYAANTVFSTDIVDGQVKTPDLASNAVTAAKIKDGEVKTAEIRDGTIKAADISTAYISYGFKSPGQHGWLPCGGGCIRTITNVPGAVEGAKIFVMLNYLPDQPATGSCAVTDVILNGFIVQCATVLPGAFLDYVVINPF